MEMIYKGVRDTDPFVVKALRKHSANEKCWCLSGKKYKRCHRNRERKSEVTVGQALQVNNDLFKVKKCMHPDTQNCSGKRIRAHTIQRNGGLKHITDDKNKVLMMRGDMGRYAPELIGWKDASTFYGFCSHHDSTAFKNIEDNVFSGSSEQCFLLYYRALCYQKYQKEAFVETLKRQKEILDNGKILDEQISIQLTLNRYIHDYGRTVSELNEEKKDADKSLITETYSNYSHLITYFTGSFDLFTTSHMHPAYDLFGTSIYDIYDDATPGEGASFSIVPVNGDTSAFVLSWNTEHSHVKTFIDGILEIPEEIRLNLMHQLLFAYSENICFSSDWWNSLDEEQKSFIKKLYSFGADNYGKELNAELTTHRWTIDRVVTVNV